jgi:FlaA1/EpsC-like NDP-sugar epimerase
LIRLPVFVYFGFYRIVIRYFSLADFKRVLVGILISSGLLLLFIGFWSGITLQNISPRVFFLDWLILATMVTGYRVIGKIFIRWKKSSSINGVSRRRALIWGADDEGVWCHRFLKECGDPIYEVVGFLDPDPRLRNRFIDGLKVLGDQTHLEACNSIYKIQEIYVTGIGKDQGELQQLAEDCRRLSLRILQFKPRTVEEIRL